MKNMVKRIFGRFGNMSLYKRTAIVFILVMLVPISLAYKLSVSFIEKMTISQVVSSSMKSIQSEGQLMDELFLTIIQSAEYLENETAIREYILNWAKAQSNPDLSDGSGKKMVLIDRALELLYKSDKPEDRLQDRLLVDKNNYILAGSGGGNNLNLNTKDLYKIEVPSGSNTGGSLLTRDAENKKCILLYKRIQSFGYAIVNVIPYSEIKDKSGIISNNLLLIYAIGMMIFLAMTVIIAGYLTKPIKKLANSMQTMDVLFDTQKSKVRYGKNKNEVVILGESFNIMRDNILRLVEENREKEKRKRDAELKALQAQISPHFLFNTLNSIRWAAINNNPSKAADMVLALENLLRMTLIQTDEFVTLEQEIESIRNYLAIVKMRHTLEFDISYDIEDSVRHYEIPKLLLQPLVENSIIHGFQYGSADGKIEISACKDKDSLTICVKDNGGGMSEIPPHVEADDNVNGNGDANGTGNRNRMKGMKFTGIGLRNVEERIKLHFGDEYGLNVESNPNQGTSVVLKLPV